jgi:hypothetical protein
LKAICGETTQSAAEYWFPDVLKEPRPAATRRKPPIAARCPASGLGTGAADRAKLFTGAPFQPHLGRSEALTTAELGNKGNPIPDADRTADNVIAMNVEFEPVAVAFGKPAAQFGAP